MMPFLTRWFFVLRGLPSSQHSARFQVISDLGRLRPPSHLPLRQIVRRFLRHGAFSSASFRRNSDFLRIAPTFGLGLAAPTMQLVATIGITDAGAALRYIASLLFCCMGYYYCHIGFLSLGALHWTTAASFAHRSDCCLHRCALFECAFQAALLPPGLALWCQKRIGRSMT